MVSGGTYGIEDVVHGAGYGRAILILLLTPILWSLPTAYMIGELSSALARRGRLLRLGASRHGRLLGLSGGLALAGGQRLRHGHLPDPVRALSLAAVPVVRSQQSRSNGWPRGGHRLRCAQYRRNPRGCDHLGLAVLSALGALRRHRHSGAVQVRRACERGHDSHNVACGHHRRPADCHVELHGVGQRFHHRCRSEAAAADLSPGHDGGRGAGLADLHPAGGRHVDDQAESHSVGDRFVGGCGGDAGWPAACASRLCWAE